MVETPNHNHQTPPSQPPHGPAPPLGGSRGPTFPPAEQLLQLHYCIHSNPSWPYTILLAFQHYIVMLGNVVMIATILVPRMGGGPGDKARVIQTMLFMSGINTLLQTLLGTRLPTVMTPSFAFVVSVLMEINDFSDTSFDSEHKRFTHTIRAVQGSLIVSSFINIVLGYSRAWGKLTRYFSPVVVVPVVCLLGLGLFARGFPQVANCVEIGLPMLILLVITQYLQHLHSITRSVLERFSLLLCIGLIWAFAAILTVAGAYNNVRERTRMSCRTDQSFLMTRAPWIKIPYPFQWGPPIFRASHVFGMMGASLISSAESIGAFYGASRLAGATIPPAYIVSRSIGLQGIGQLLDGIFGSLAGTTASVYSDASKGKMMSFYPTSFYPLNASLDSSHKGRSLLLIIAHFVISWLSLTYSENIGLLGLTRVGSRRVVEISTAFMIFFSIFGKFGAFFASIPLPIFAAVYCVLYAIVAAVGVSFIQFANPNSMRNIYIIGLSLFLGMSIPQYFIMNSDVAGHGPVHTGAGWFNNILNTIFSSPPVVAMIVGTILDNTLEARDANNDRGIPWFVPFQSRKGDSRNEEFYNYPLRINEYIPSRFR